MPFLQLGWSDPRTGVTYPQAALIIDDARVHLAANQALLGISIYGTAALASGGKAPIINDPDFHLTPAELQTLQNAFIQQLYQILAARPEYAGSTVVA